MAPTSPLDTPTSFSVFASIVYGKHKPSYQRDVKWPFTLERVLLDPARNLGSAAFPHGASSDQTEEFRTDGSVIKMYSSTIKLFTILIFNASRSFKNLFQRLFHKMIILTKFTSIHSQRLGARRDSSLLQLSKPNSSSIRRHLATNF